MTRVFCAALGTETNTFSPLPTSLASFRDHDYCPAGSNPDHPSSFGALWQIAQRRGKELGWDVQAGLIASAQPSGVTTRLAYEALRDELLADLQQSMPVDLVLLSLHGAMVAEGYDDCEGDVLERVRAVVGDKAVIGAELDLHAHLTERMVERADILVLYKEYPHTDIVERAEELVDLCASTLRKQVRPVGALVDCDMIVPMHTTRDPGKTFVRRMRSEEGRGGVLSVSLAHGFATGDVPEMGTRVLVYADGDEAAARALALKLADELVSMREELLIPYRSIDDALNEALAFEGRPVVLADRPDNPGSGAPGDATFLLRRMLERGVRDAVVGPFWDPGAVRIAFDAQPGACLPMRLGGKAGPLSGMPVDVECTVRALIPDLGMTGLANEPLSMGDAALVDAQGIEIVLTSHRNQAMDVDLFINAGCDLSSKKIIVVKSAQHFYASFSQIAAHTIYVGGQGVATPDWWTLRYQKASSRKWPLDRGALPEPRLLLTVGAENRRSHVPK